MVLDLKKAEGGGGEHVVTKFYQLSFIVPLSGIMIMKERRNSTSIWVNFPPKAVYIMLNT